MPYVPAREELPEQSADATLGFPASFPAEEQEPGLATVAVAVAVAEFTGPVAGEEPRHELVVTHNFLVVRLVSEALDAPKARWWAPTRPTRH
ncbi:hypothetical protein GCM10022244_30070 [Streptomyces gulbargensis]|uniref:Phosphoglycerate mutase n=1 Tax=Streptomyces gulbargensis TaxID=364901 RepID=A0ABP7MDN7_9ACTN